MVIFESGGKPNVRVELACERELLGEDLRKVHELCQVMLKDLVMDGNNAEQIREIVSGSLERLKQLASEQAVQFRKQVTLEFMSCLRHLFEAQGVSTVDIPTDDGDFGVFQVEKRGEIVTFVANDFRIRFGPSEGLRRGAESGDVGSIDVSDVIPPIVSNQEVIAFLESVDSKGSASRRNRITVGGQEDTVGPTDEKFERLFRKLDAIKRGGGPERQLPCPKRRMPYPSKEAVEKVLGELERIRRGA